MRLVTACSRQPIACATTFSSSLPQLSGSPSCAGILISVAHNVEQPCQAIRCYAMFLWSNKE